MSKLQTIYHILAGYRYYVVILGGIALLGFVGENSYLAHLRHQNTIQLLNDEIQEQNDQYKADTEKYYQLSTDVEAVKRVAREQYFMKAEDEDVFIIQE